MNSMVNRLKASLLDRGDAADECHKCTRNCNCSSIDKKVDAMLGKHVLFDLDVGMLVCLLDQIRIKDRFKKVTRTMQSMVHGQQAGASTSQAAESSHPGPTSDKRKRQSGDFGGVAPGRSRGGSYCSTACSSRRQSYLMEQELFGAGAPVLPSYEDLHPFERSFEHIERSYERPIERSYDRSYERPVERIYYERPLERSYEEVQVPCSSKTKAEQQPKFEEDFVVEEDPETTTFLDAVLNHQQRALDEIMNAPKKEECISKHVDVSATILKEDNDESHLQKNGKLEESTAPQPNSSEMKALWSRMDEDVNTNVADHDVKDLKSFATILRKLSTQRRPRTEWEQMMADVKAVHKHKPTPLVYQAVPVGHQTTPFGHDIRQPTPLC